MKRGSVLFLLLLLFIQIGTAQKIIGVGSRYNNSFREWIITTDDEDIEGQLRMRWAFRDDWTEWDLSIGDISATIEQKWTDDPNLWVIRCEGETVNAKTAWSGEFHRWKLSDGHHHLNWQAEYANHREEWELDTQEDYFFEMRTYWEGDPREWVVKDELPEDITMAMRIAMIFLTLHFSTPRI